METQERCFYCNSLIDDSVKIDAYDYLHEDTKGKWCCQRCNRLITDTNKFIAVYTTTRNKENIKIAIKNLRNILGEIK